MPGWGPVHDDCQGGGKGALEARCVSSGGQGGEQGVIIANQAVAGLLQGGSVPPHTVPAAHTQSTQALPLPKTLASPHSLCLSNDDKALW